MLRLKFAVMLSVCAGALVTTPVQANPLQAWTGRLLDWGQKRPVATVTTVGFIPPTGGLPANREGGSARGGMCPNSPQRLTALLPSSSLGLTIAARPSFFAYLPPTGGRPVELMLQNAQGEVLHLSSFQTNKVGLVRVDLPNNAPELTVGDTYRWYLSIICDPNDSSASLHVGGWVQRVALSDNLRQQLVKTPVADRPYLYAKAGLWHETLVSLMELRQSQPGNASLQTDWTSLLKFEGLEQVAQEPFVGNL
jgi:hypothetical protein